MKSVEADASLFSFEDVFRYDANGLALDLDAISLRFEERTLDNKPERKDAGKDGKAGKSSEGCRDGIHAGIEKWERGFIHPSRSRHEDDGHAVLFFA
ncbi:MAG: hypothetical protein IKK82_03415 [Kiritimatiellae bacterium]|nr:hypothetical protein [Kiritimatiellia bacterium]